MRKLRDDIMLKEAWEWALKGATEVLDNDQGVYDVLYDLVVCQPRDDYPDSFYEDPPLVCFGQFRHPVDGYRDAVIYGWRHAMSGRRHRCRWDSRNWDTFTPGPPTNVDENGWPK